MRFESQRICPRLRREASWCVTLVALLFAFGCGGSPKPTTKTTLPEDAEGLGPTIGMLTEVFASNAIQVRGYALAGGLNGTGSGECPAPVRGYLKKYILQHFAGRSVNVNSLLASPDTAVVIVEGIIPPAASKGQRFDVRVSALPGTQTTSLEGGWLYSCDLYEARQLGISIKALASAEGPIYIDSLDTGSADSRTGFCFGGGSVIDEYKINLALRRPDYRIASQIRNRVNGRFGHETALALAPGSVELRVPGKYANEKNRFIRLVGATYLIETPELVEKRILSHIRKLVSGPNKSADELALEAIGNEAVPELAAILNSSDPEVCFRAARCMSNLGDARGREVLWSVATDKESTHRIEAINAIVDSTVRQEAAPLFRILLRDDDFSVRLAAYENLVRLSDAAISRKPVAGSFYLDQISAPGKPAVFVSRREQARVALFGAPIYCRSNLFVETPDGTITINALPGEQVATIIRRHPRRPDIIVHLKSSLDLADIIQTLCSEPVSQPSEGGPGLGVSYSTLAGILKQMVDSGAVPAEFHVGPLPRELPNIKK
ncbi:MAG: flagellar basal body P-ring protein FlgI [Planctomycetota bacterium]